MVCLLMGHITLQTPAPSETVREIYQTALDARSCEQADSGNLIAVNYGISQLHLVCRPEDLSNEASTLFTEAFGKKPVVSTPRPRPLAGHIEMWTREPLEEVAARLAQLLPEDAQPTVVDGPDARLLCTCPWGNRLLIRHAPESFDFRGELPGGHGSLAAISRAVLAVPRGAALGVRNFFVMTIGSMCEYKTAGPPEAQIAYCVAHFGSGQQVVFEERDDDDDEIDEPSSSSNTLEQEGEATEGELESARKQAVRPARTHLCIYLQSREAFRSAFMACGTAGCLLTGGEAWEHAERSHRFIARLQGSCTGKSPVVPSRIELEIRSITHPLCPQGTGRRPGSGRMPGGFGEAARQLAAEKSSDGTRSSTSSANSKRPPRPPTSKMAKPSPSKGLRAADANAPRVASPKPSKASPRPQGDGKGVKRR